MHFLGSHNEYHQENRRHQTNRHINPDVHGLLAAVHSGEIIVTDTDAILFIASSAVHNAVRTAAIVLIGGITLDTNEALLTGATAITRHLIGTLAITATNALVIRGTLAFAGLTEVAGLAVLAVGTVIEVGVALALAIAVKTAVALAMAVTAGTSLAVHTPVALQTFGAGVSGTPALVADALA